MAPPVAWSEQGLMPSASRTRLRQGAGPSIAEPASSSRLPNRLSLPPLAQLVTGEDHGVRRRRQSGLSDEERLQAHDQVLALLYRDQRLSPGTHGWRSRLHGSCTALAIISEIRRIASFEMS
jgi:hypothetical protein